MTNAFTKVLLLNSSYEPLHICSWKRAIILLIKGKAVQVEFHPEKILGGGFHLPLVIRLLYYVKMPYKEIPLTRKNLMHRDNYFCQYCGKQNDLTIDHVMPRSRGGKDTWDNVVVACLRCNVKKGNKTPAEAGMDLKRKPCSPFNFVNFELSKQRQAANRDYDQWRKYLYESSHDD
ncbi:MAG: HNH endonuclease [Cyanobacteria bacterium]|nr:HNH endonuclease [Cyanobacteriota bacterium]